MSACQAVCKKRVCVIDVEPEPLLPIRPFDFFSSFAAVEDEYFIRLAGNIADATDSKIGHKEPQRLEHRSSKIEKGCNI